jgi:hypothetical protein
MNAPAQKTNADLISEQVLVSRLSSAPGMGDVHAWVAGGEATITGRVRDKLDILRVEKMARAVDGVLDVKMLLQVDPNLELNEPPPWSDEPINAQAEIGDTPGINTAPAGDSTDTTDMLTTAPAEGAPSVMPITGPEAGIIDGTMNDTVDAVTPNPSPAADDLSAFLQKGMKVVDKEGKVVGKVRTIRPTDFLLGRGWARDVYVPYYACHLEDDRVNLKVEANEISHQGWASPRLM